MMPPQEPPPQDLDAGHRANRLLTALEPEDFAGLEPHLELVALTRGQVLYDTGDAVSHAYFPHDTVVSLVNVLEDGSGVEVAVFGREGVLGLLSALVTHEAFGRYVVQMPGTASRIPVERLNEVRHACPALRRLIMHYGEVLLAQTFQRVTCNAVHSVEARCCRWILRIHDRVGRDALPLTHEFLAEMLGVQRSTVSVVTRSLHTAGLIQQNRGGITVTNRAGLEAAACECYGRIRRLYDRLLAGHLCVASSLPAGRRMAGPIHGGQILKFRSLHDRQLCPPQRSKFNGSPSQEVKTRRIS